MPTKRRHVAIIGAGPAGCAAAYEANRLGWDVTVYEQSDAPGGCARTYRHQMPDGSGVNYEVGPQIAYSRYPEIWSLFRQFLSFDITRQYIQLVSLWPGCAEQHKFPPSHNNLAQLGIYPPREAPQHKLYETLREYLRIEFGEAAFRAYYEGYNRKQWGRWWPSLSADWALARHMTFRPRGEEGQVFGRQEQGHPGNYQPLWSGLLSGIRVHYGRSVTAAQLAARRTPPNVIISTIGTDRPYLPMRSVAELYFHLRTGGQPVLTTYLVSFPNVGTPFTRMLDYRQQCPYEGEYSLVSLSLPLGRCISAPADATLRAAGRLFDAQVPYVLGSPVFSHMATLPRAYPVNTRETEATFATHLRNTTASACPILPVGRAGLFCYCSKDVAMWQGISAARQLDEYPRWTPHQRYCWLMDLRREMR